MFNAPGFLKPDKCCCIYHENKHPPEHIYFAYVQTDTRSLPLEQVFFVVGNHEMWTGRRKSTAKGGGEGEPEGVSSVDKLVQLHRMCEVGGHPAPRKNVSMYHTAYGTDFAVFFVGLKPADGLRGRIGWGPLQDRAPRYLVVHEGVHPSHAKFVVCMHVLSA